MLKNIFIYAFAAFLDLFQMALVTGFTFIGSISGTVGGAIAGNVLGQKVCSVPVLNHIQSLCQAIGTGMGGILGSFANPALAPEMTEVGAFVGLILAACVTYTVGSAFIFFLWTNNFIPKTQWPIVAAIYLGKALPGSDIAPTWTFLVFKCSIHKLTPAITTIAKDTVIGGLKGLPAGPEAVIGLGAKAAAQSTARTMVKDIRTKNDHKVVNLKDYRTQSSTPRKWAA